MYLYCRTNNNVQIRPFAFKVKIPLALLFHSSTIVAKNKIKPKKNKHVFHLNVHLCTCTLLKQGKKRCHEDQKNINK